MSMKERIRRAIAEFRLNPKLPQARHWLHLALALFLAGLFFKLSYDVLFDVEDRALIQAWDDRILNGVAAYRTERLTSSMIDVTALGSGTLVTMFAIVFLCVFLLLGDYLRILQLVSTAIGAGVWTWAFKNFAERPRPSAVHPLVSVSGHSFPSGHTLSAAALYVTFALIVAKHARTWKHALALQGLAAAMILSVAASRVYLGVHYPSDVVSGALYGASWAYFVAAAVSWLESRSRT